MSIIGSGLVLDGNCTCCVGKVQSVYISGQLKDIPLFCYSVFRVLPIPHLS